MNSFLKGLEMCSGKKKICNQKTQTISRTQSKPNLPEGHNVFWGFIPLFFTYTVLGPARAKLGFELSTAKHHKGKKVQALCPECTSSPRENWEPWEALGSQQPHQPPSCFRASLYTGADCSPQLPLAPPRHRCTKGSQWSLNSGNPTAGLVRKAGCQNGINWLLFPESIFPPARPV